MAMTLMLMDHLWATIMPMQDWLTCAGRLAFPIFAFLIVEGYFHTSNFKRYIRRLTIFALLSEIPFNLMYSGVVCYPFHQNVLWTFLLGLWGISIMERVRKKGKPLLFVLTATVTVFLGYILGTLSMVDYYGAGVLTIFVFYFFRKRKWWCLLGQIAALYWINVELLAGQFYSVSVLGINLDLYQQSLALISLIPIWLYHGRQGYHSKGFQYFCYAFYPCHMLILGLIAVFS